MVAEGRAGEGDAGEEVAWEEWEVGGHGGRGC